MPHYNLPHNHGQKMASVLEKMPAGEDFQSVAEIFSGLGDSSRLGYYGCYVTVRNAPII